MGQTFEAAWLSCCIAFASVILTLPMALAVSSLLYRSRFRALEVVFLLPLLLPPTVCGFFLLMFFSPYSPVGAVLQSLGLKVVFTPLGTILACCVVSFPLAFQACILGLSRVGLEVRESVRLLSGSAGLNTVRVVWPQMKGAIAMAGLLIFARSLGEFGASVMVGGNQPGYTQTLPLLIYSWSEVGRFPEAAGAALVSVVLGVGIYLLLRRLERLS